ncbi:MAG: WD40 repeat domain-containing protein, partial [Planctomycetota bacterium]
AKAIARYELGHAGDEIHDMISVGTDRLLCVFSTWHATELGLGQSWVLERVIGDLDGRSIPDRVTALDFRPDGQVLAIGSGDPSRSGVVMVASVSNGAILRTFDSLHSDTVLSLRFSPDGRRLASGSSDKTIRLLDVQSQGIVAAMDGHTHHVMSLTWSWDGRVIASVSADKTIKVWDAVTGQQKRTIGGIPDELTAIAFLDRTSEVAVACGNGEVRIYNVDNGQMLRRSVAGGFLLTLAVTSDGGRILTGGQSGEVKVWNRVDGKLLSTWKE